MDWFTLSGKTSANRDGDGYPMGIIIAGEIP
jgi:hypothetical protein